MRIKFLNAADLEPRSQSEEHLVLKCKEDHTYQTGDILYGLPYHVCPTVALYERVITVKNGIADGEWLNTARDRKIFI